MQAHCDGVLVLLQELDTARNEVEKYKKAVSMADTSVSMERETRLSQELEQLRRCAKPQNICGQEALAQGVCKMHMDAIVSVLMRRGGMWITSVSTCAWHHERPLHVRLAQLL